MKIRISLLIVLNLFFLAFTYAQWDSNGSNIYYNGGNVGIGTSDPTTKLHVRGAENNGTTATLKIKSGSQEMILDGNEIDALTNGLYLNHNSAKNVHIATGGGKVGIGTTSIPTGYKLAVNGKVIATELKIQVYPWADYVFQENYPLLPLEELEKSIQENGHLPGIPSAAEVEANGIEVGDIQKRTMEKVEELTLYILQLKKQNDELMKRIEALEKK